MTKKTKPIGKLVDDCATLTQKLVRLKAADKHGICKCVTCGNASTGRKWTVGISSRARTAAGNWRRRTSIPSVKVAIGLATKSLIIMQFI